MIEHTSDEVAYYYDSHPTEEDLIGESPPHAALVHYLMDVLAWLFHDRMCSIYENFNFYQTRNRDEKPLAPDVAIIKGVAYRQVRSWRVGVYGPAPQVVFEIASEETWKRDLEEKPDRYAMMGVQEYFAYDPNIPPIRRSDPSRLIGWQLDKDSGVVQKMLPGPGGRLWSRHLDSLLVPDGPYLRLYDRHGNLRLTKGEAEAEKARIFAEKLRSLGVDPEQLI
jgi:Uma2 family endonuclease